MQKSYVGEASPLCMPLDATQHSCSHATPNDLEHHILDNSKENLDQARNSLSIASMYQKARVDEFSTSFFAPSQNSIVYIEEQDLLTRLNEEAKRDLSLRESLEEHKQLYYQNALPASFTSIDSNVVFLNHGTFSLNLFSYIRDDKRRLVLNRYSYNTFVELAQKDKAYLPTFTFVEHDGVMNYLVKPDLSMNPEMYGARILFRSPEEVVARYGEIQS